MSALPERRHLNAVEARALTDRIRDTAEALWSLLWEAHEGRAWAALDYDRWEDYVRAEFDMSRQRSYQILDQARVIRAIGSVSTTVDISEREARDVSPRLAEVVDIVRDRVAHVPPEKRAEVVRDVVNEERAKAQHRKRDRDELASFVDEFQPDGFDPATEDERIALTHALFDAIAALASMPPAGEVIEHIPAYQQYRFDALPSAVAWLNEFADKWETR